MLSLCFGDVECRGQTSCCPSACDFDPCAVFGVRAFWMWRGRKRRWSRWISLLIDIFVIIVPLFFTNHFVIKAMLISSLKKYVTNSFGWSCYFHISLPFYFKFLKSFLTWDRVTLSCSPNDVQKNISHFQRQTAGHNEGRRAASKDWAQIYLLPEQVGWGRNRDEACANWQCSVAPRSQQEWRLFKFGLSHFHYLHS